MAAVTVLRATQDMLRISTPAPGGEGNDTATLTQAQLVAAFAGTPGASGPLEALFKSPFNEPAGSGGVAIWAALGTTDARLSISQRATDATPTDFPGFNVNFAVISSVATLTIGLTGTGTVITEFRYNRTENR